MKSTITTFFFIANFLFFFSLTGSAKDIYVNPVSGNDTNDGTTVENSLQTIVQGYTMASDGDVIKLDGTFLLESELSIEKSITIESSGTAKAILDGQGACRFFTLKNNVTFRNLIFQNGYASEGGALFIPIGYWRDINILDCTFDGNNSAGQGGVIRMITYGGTDLLKINRCVFVNNLSGDHGGTISYIPEGGDPVGNKATLTISNSTFARNKNNGGVGGIMFVGGGAAQWATFNFNNITVSGNSDIGNANGNIPGFAFVGTQMKVNINNSIIEGNPSPNGDYADFAFDGTPTALTVKNSIIGHVTIWGATVDPSNFTVTESNVNNVKIATDALVAGLGEFNGTYFPLTITSLAYQYGKTGNLTPEINADQLGHPRTNSNYTSAGSVEFYHDVTSGVNDLNSKPTLFTDKNQLLINAENSKAEVYNLSGIKVISTMVNGSTSIKLKSGIYIVKITSSVNNSSLKVIIN